MNLNWKAQEILKVLHDSGEWMTAREIGEGLGYYPPSVANVILHYLEDGWVEIKRFDGVGPYWKPSLYKVLPVNIPDYVVNR